MSDSWQGRSQTPGQRARGARRFRLPRSWRLAAGCFVCAAALYGLIEGGYVQRTTSFATKKVSTIVVRAGFAVSRVTIEGQDRTSNAEIVRALGIDRNSSTLAFDTGAARKRLESLPLVRRAEVMRLLPSQLHVVIEERVPYAVWQHNSALQLIDRDGTVIGSAGSGGRHELPLVVGDGAAANARDLLDELAHWPDIKSRVEAAVRVGDRRWNLKLAGGPEIRLPETDTARALKKLAELDATHRILTGDAVSIDLRLPDRVTIRLNETAASRRDSDFAVPGKIRSGPGQDT